MAIAREEPTGMIRFGEWLPDLPDLGNPGLVTCDNVYSDVGSYKKFSAAVTYSTTAIDAAPKGAFSFFNSDSALRIYAGSSAKLYDVTQPTPVDMTPSGNAYHVPADSWWEFARFGSSVYATNLGDQIQVSVNGANFVDLGGGSPHARFLTATKNFLVLGYTNEETYGLSPQRIWWSAIGDPTNWPTPGGVAAAQVQSGTFNVEDSEGGEIMSLIGGEDVVIFLKRAIYRLEYVGGVDIWGLRKLDSLHGLQVRKCAIRVGQTIYFLDASGFYALTGNQVAPIGAGKVDKYFYSNVNTNYMTTCHVAADVRNKSIIWMYPRSSTSATTPDAGLCYNFETGRWSRIVVSDLFMFSAASSGYTLDELDALQQSLDDMTLSLDSAVFLGGDPLLAGFTSDFKLKKYNGSALAGTIETAEYEFIPGKTTRINGIRPSVNGSPTVTVDVGKRNLQSGSVSYLASPVSVNTRTGWHDLISNDRFQRIKISTSGDFSHLSGFDVDIVSTGSI